MKTIEKYKTFEELKAAEKASSNKKESLKKHAAFESLLHSIYTSRPGNITAPKSAILNGK